MCKGNEDLTPELAYKLGRIGACPFRRKAEGKVVVVRIQELGIFKCHDCRVCPWD